MTTPTITYSAELNKYAPETISATEYESICKRLNCYEILPADIPVKLYFDVDIKTIPDDQDDGKALIAEMPRLRAQILNVFSKFFEEAYDPKQLSISTSHNPYYKPYNTSKKALDESYISKLSFHFVFNNIIALVSHQKVLIDRLNAFAISHIDADDINTFFHGEVFDTAPYMKTQKIRSPYSNKPLENRPLKIEQGTFEQSCITAFIPSTAYTHVEYIPEKPICDGPNGDIMPAGNYELTIFKEGMRAGLLTPYAKSGTYAKWIRVIWSIRNVFNRRELAHDFSKLCLKTYDADAVDKIWDDGERGGVGMGTIIEFMRQTDKLKTNDIIKMANEIRYKDDLEEARKQLIESINVEPEPETDTESDTSSEGVESINHVSYYIKIDDLEDPYNCAVVISKTLKHTLVLCSEKWYMVNELNLWASQNEPTYYITSEIRKYIDEGQKQTAHKISRANGEVKDKLIEIQKRYLKAYRDISKPAYLSVLTKNLKTLLCDRLFIKKIDKLTDQLAFKNGVYNLKTGMFRYGILPSDYITDTIQYDYMPANPEKTQFVKNVLLKIMNNNPEHLEYFLSIIGYTFIGRPNLEKAFYFCVDKTLQSKGDNGKTFYFDILTELMPCYVYNTKGTFLETNNAKRHKQLALMKGKLLVWVDEFGTKQVDPIFVKELSNGLATENEVMFGTSEKIDIQFKMYGLTNHMVKIGDNEDAVFNRYVQVSYGSHFDKTGALKEDIPEQLRFKADNTLRETLLCNYANEIFGLIIEYANKYYKRRLPPVPTQFAQDAAETKMANDEFGSWIQENCVVEEEARVALKALVFASGMNEKKIKENMKRLGYKYDKDLRKCGKDQNGIAYKGGYVGVKIVEESEEEFDMEDA